MNPDVSLLIKFPGNYSVIKLPFTVYVYNNYIGHKTFVYNVTSGMVIGSEVFILILQFLLRRLEVVSMSKKYMHLFKKGDSLSASLVDLEVEECDDDYLFDVAVESSRFVEKGGKKMLVLNGVDVVEVKDGESKEDALNRAFAEGIVYSYCGD